MKIKFLESFINTIFTPNTSQEYIQQTQKILTWAGLFLILSASITTTMNFRKGYILMGIWGDTVNVASRMQDTALPGTIRISQSFMEKIKGSEFKISDPIYEQIKNHGEMTTYELEIE